MSILFFVFYIYTNQGSFQYTIQQDYRFRC